MQTTEPGINTQLTDSPLRLWTVADYYRMAETGILSADDRVELVAGQIIRKMSPQGIPHALAITLSRRVIDDRLNHQVLVRVQLPIRLSNYSEPEPDISVVMPDELRYVDHHPSPSEVYWLIEIADITLKIDCGLKAQDSAQSAIADYWVLNLKQRQLHIFREPNSEGYQSIVVLAADATISPLQFPALSIQVQELLPPV